MEHFPNQLVHGTKIHFYKIICQIIQAEQFFSRILSRRSDWQPLGGIIALSK